MNKHYFWIAVLGLATTAIILRVCLFYLSRRRMMEQSRIQDVSHKEMEESWDKLLTFIISIIGCLAAIYAIYDTSNNVENNTAQARVAASFSFMQQMNTDGFVKYSNFRLEAIEEHLDTNAINKQITNDDKMVQTVTSMLGDFEDMSVAIKSKYVDEKVLYYELRNITLWSSTNLAIHINDVRQLRGTNYLDEFDDLVKAWKDTKSLADGHVFAGKNYNSQ